MRFFTFIFSLLFAFQAMAFNPSDLRAFGTSAPVQLYLFTSLGCPYCANFHRDIFPTLKKEYADTGKAQIIVVDMIHGGNSMTATQAVRCLNMKAADKLENDLYANQSSWMRKPAAEAYKTIASYAARQGMTQKQFNECVSDKELQEIILEQQTNLSHLYDVHSFPTLVMREGTEVHKWSGADKKIFKALKEAFQK